MTFATFLTRLFCCAVVVAAVLLFGQLAIDRFKRAYWRELVPVECGLCGVVAVELDDGLAEVAWQAHQATYHNPCGGCGPEPSAHRCPSCRAADIRQDQELDLSMWDF